MTNTFRYSANAKGPTGPARVKERTKPKTEKVSEQIINNEYDYVVTYHKYTHKKPIVMEVPHEELGLVIASIMKDGTNQYLMVWRKRDKPKRKATRK